MKEAMKPIKIPEQKLDLGRTLHIIIGARTRSEVLVLVKQGLSSIRRAGGDRIGVVALELHANTILVNTLTGIINHGVCVGELPR